MVSPRRRTKKNKSTLEECGHWMQKISMCITFFLTVFDRSENRRPVGVVVFMAMTIKARRLFVIQCVVVKSEISLRKSSGHNFGPKEGGTVNRSKMLQHGLSCSSLLERLARKKWLMPTAALTGTELVLFGLGRVDVVEIAEEHFGFHPILYGFQSSQFLN